MSTHIGTQEAGKHPITDIVMRLDIAHTVPHAVDDARVGGVVPDRRKDGRRQRVQPARDPPGRGGCIGVREVIRVRRGRCRVV